MSTETKLPRGGWRFLALACLVATLGGFLFGYDTGVISGAIGFLKDKFNLSPAQQGWASGCILIGCMIGVVIAGPVGDWLGRKKLLLLSGLLFGVSSVGTAVPETLTVFIIFRVLAGVGVGVASIASPMYIAEISPPRLRGRLISVYQLAIVGGIFIVYFINWFISGLHTPEWNVSTGWRWMFASCAFPSLIYVLLVFWVPESPRWLVEKGRREQALATLAKINGPEIARAEIGAIEEAISKESGSLLQLLLPGWRTALLVGVVLAVLQQVTGINAFIYFGPEIFKKLGSETNAALLMNVTVGAANALFTIIAIRQVDRWGRRPLMIAGAIGMGLCLFAMAIAAFYYRPDASAADASLLRPWALALLSFLMRPEMWILYCIVGYIACFAMSLGPVTWVVIAEIFPTRIRAQAMGVATLCLWLADYAVTQTFPMMNENPWLVETFHRGFPFLVYGVLCVVEVFFVWRFVPETKNKSLEEIEQLWQRSA